MTAHDPGLPERSDAGDVRALRRLLDAARGYKPGEPVTDEEREAVRLAADARQAEGAAMSDLVPADQIERIVGVERHPLRHYARAVSAEQTVYILHSAHCKAWSADLRNCPYSRALDKGIDVAEWAGFEDRPIRVGFNRSGRLIPVYEATS